MSPNQPQFEDVDGIEIAVEAKKPLSKFPEKEWLLAKISEAKKQMPQKAGYDPQLSFTFLLVDEPYANRKAWYNTPVTGFVGNNLYNLYMEVLGLKELPVGQTIKPSLLVGKFCYIMFEKARKNPEKQVIGLIKHYEPSSHSNSTVTSAVQHSAAVSAQKENKVRTEHKAQNAPVQTEELNIDDISVDDL